VPTGRELLVQIIHENYKVWSATSQRCPLILYILDINFTNGYIANGELNKDTSLDWIGIRGGV
jgi:hypothetical protein